MLKASLSRLDSDTQIVHGLRNLQTRKILPTTLKSNSEFWSRLLEVWNNGLLAANGRVLIKSSGCLTNFCLMGFKID